MWLWTIVLQGNTRVQELEKTFPDIKRRTGWQKLRNLVLNVRMRTGLCDGENLYFDSFP